MEHERLHAPALRGPDLGLAVMAYLLEQCASWPLVQGLLAADLERWTTMKDGERRTAFVRAVRRTMLVAPWVADKGRVADAARALGL